MVTAYLIHGDNLIDSDVIPSGTVDLVLTDPPYNISNVKQNNFKSMGRAGVDFGEWDKDADLLSWMHVAKRISTKDANLLFFNLVREMGSMMDYCETVGYEVKNNLIWQKNNPMPRNRDRRYINDFELMCLAVVKRAKWVFNRQSDTYDRAILNYPITPASEKKHGGHTTQKPLALMDDLVLTLSNEGQTICDLYMGSGSTGVSALRNGRNFIGIEQDAKYFDIAVKRISEVTDNIIIL